jgi:hypothetical protein
VVLFKRVDVEKNKFTREVVERDGREICNCCDRRVAFVIKVLCIFAAQKQTSKNIHPL